MKQASKIIAALGLILGSGLAFAQSSVNLFGTLDVNIRAIDNEGFPTRKVMGSDGRGNSRLGFRGSEDLGSRTFAEFWLEAQVLPQTGSANATKFFNRRSTVSLRSDTLGEIRLGRDYTPTFYGVSAFDPYGHNGIGLISNVDPYGPMTTFTRSDNSIQYVLPPLGGVYGNIMVAPGEGNPNAKYRGARLGYAQGRLDVRGSFGQQDVNEGLPTGGKFRTWTLGGKYDFGFASAQANYIDEKLDSSVSGAPAGTFRHWMLGTVVPFGLSEFKASYNHGSMGGGNGATQLALGYVYNLSKRTALYGTVSRLENEGKFANSIDAGLPSGQTKVVAGGRSQGVELGITHQF